MIQEIIDGAVAALLDAFPGIKVYTEQVKQGLEEPCFILRVISPTNEQFLGNRYYRTNLLSVQYFAESETDAKAECYRVCDALFRVLEYVTVCGGPTRGTGMRGDVLDGVLTFTVNYNLFVRIKTEFDPMEDLTVENYAR